MSSGTTSANVETLSHAVQRNCHISDAQHAGSYTLCVYLLKMREYYRWEKGLPFHEQLPSQAVGDWLTEREELWDRLAEQPFERLPIEGQWLDPFDTDSINRLLIPQGLVYSGGVGISTRPHFFLGRLLRHERHSGYTVLVSTDEFARDLTAPPAMTLGKTIFIRRESLRRMLWEKIEEWLWRRHEGAMSRALACYDFDQDPEAALNQMTDRELESAILHEIGEVQAGELLGDTWHEMLGSIPHSRAELMARAVRDHIADCLSTLPELLQEERTASLHFYFGNLRGMRKELFPAIESAYRSWNEHNSTRELERMVRLGAVHWGRVGREALKLFRDNGASAVPKIEDLIQQNAL